MQAGSYGVITRTDGFKWMKYVTACVFDFI